MMKKLATPALFLTLNPADIIDPLLGAMAGISSSDWAAMSDFQRHRFVAHNPGPAAIFFNEVISNFIRIILRYDPLATEESQNGLFGRCSGYYATVEAQGAEPFIATC
ncbi:hypothetical protein B0H17DRAFT_1136418 [Mycena rosella]|uniref:Helitron helicase-like domain-containing protein n=1 Tax=Mycena rosella TaxID=1033263 RepID=A0AAD7DCN1_MYCRO|nr:hypothetical protein B0H17DRAFT_1136418 [Mycena rosella]